MTEVVFRKMPSGLVPADETQAELLGRIPHGDLVKADVRRSRNLAWHNFWWALVHKAYQCLPDAAASRYPTLDAFRKALLVHLGRYDSFEMKDGRVVVSPQSISFAKMDQTEFERLVRDTTECIARDFIPNMDEAAQNELLEMMA